jgi:hypothetical protein
MTPRARNRVKGDLSGNAGVAGIVTDRFPDERRRWPTVRR